MSGGEVSGVRLVGEDQCNIHELWNESYMESLETPGFHQCFPIVHPDLSSFTHIEPFAKPSIKV